MKKLCLLIYLSTSISLFSCLSKANDLDTNYDIVDLYRNLIKTYNYEFLKGDYEGAFETAKKIWSLDPSSTNTYLMIALAAREINSDNIKIIETFGRGVAERSIEAGEIKELANIILRAPNKSTESKCDNKSCQQ